MADGWVKRRGEGSGASSTKQVRAALAARLRERLPELQGTVANRVYAISDPREVSDPAYLEGLNEAVGAAVEHRLEVLEAGERQAPAVPEVLLAQARLDARDGIPLDTVLRRYFAGNSHFGDFLVEEAERVEVPRSTLQRLLGEQSTQGDRLIAAVSAEHARAMADRPSSPAERRRRSVKALLDGELVDPSELGYDLDAHHLALMARGEQAGELMRTLADDLGRSLLLVQREEEPQWAGWLGGRHPLPPEEAVRALRDRTPSGAFVTVGEPAAGLAGWRFSHFQAKAALPIAERRGEPVVRYADVAMLAAIARDDLLAASLRELYLVPLAQTKDGGRIVRETLRAYFEAERNVSSAAAALGVDRHTVRNRLQAAEELLGRPLQGSLADLEIALRLDE
ncbi:MAG TPA: helix-turn-helix domain-containing protein [Solirubrobacterales bacterium]|nr:helix-turn-helix domain-containing protein [Solirubrobacterales bacterium]